MRIRCKWVAAAIATLFTLLAAMSAFASKPKKTTEEVPAAVVAGMDTASAVNSIPEMADEADSTELVVTLEANDVSKASQVRTASSKAAASVPQYLRDRSVEVSSTVKSIATGLLGTPYRWGGTTPQAFDCSGFTQYCYRKVGVKLPRTAREQYRSGAKVKSGTWQVGDLVFFDMSKGYVSHVGMYLSQMSFIHASTPSTGVRIDSLKTRSYKKHYVGARRYLSS